MEAWAERGRQEEMGLLDMGGVDGRIQRSVFRTMTKLKVTESQHISDCHGQEGMPGKPTKSCAPILCRFRGSLADSIVGRFPCGARFGVSRLARSSETLHAENWIL